MSAVAIAVPMEPVDVEQGFIDGITERYNRIYRDIFEIGAILAEARRVLSYHQFVGMIERKLPFGRSTAYAYIGEWAAQMDSDSAVQPVGQLSDSYSVRIELDRLQKSHPEHFDAGIAAGRIRPGVSRSQVVELRRELASAHVHRPESRKCPPPSRPERAGALTYPEWVYCMIEWRRSKGISQCALDDRVGWGEGQTSKYEIPHQDDGRIASWEAMGQWMQGLGIGIALVPLE